ncbi:unnamed protein product [Phaeothamnion confervicola]
MLSQEREDAGNAATLNFGKEFEDVQCVTNSEVAIILDKQKKHYDALDITASPAFTATLMHVKRFSSAADDPVQAITLLRQALEEFEAYSADRGGLQKLHQFEIVQLANLITADSSAEEVTALIPSIGQKFDQEDVEKILDVIRSQQHGRLG